MSSEQNKEPVPDAIEMPAPTGWPMVLAFGLTLLASGLVTHPAVSIAGLLLTLRAAVGWFKELFPMEKHEWVPVVPESQRARLIKGLFPVRWCACRQAWPAIVCASRQRSILTRPGLKEDLLEAWRWEWWLVLMGSLRKAASGIR